MPGPNRRRLPGLLLELLVIVLPARSHKGAMPTPAPLIAVLTAYPPATDAIVTDCGLNDDGFSRQRVWKFRCQSDVAEG